MNFNNYTQKSIEAVQSSAAAGGSEFSSADGAGASASGIAAAGGRSDPSAAEKDGRYGGKSGSAAEAELRKIPGSADKSGNGRFYVSADVQAAFNAAEQQAQTMKDEYVSVEHLFLGLLELPGAA